MVTQVQSLNKNPENHGVGLGLRPREPKSTARVEGSRVLHRARFFKVVSIWVLWSCFSIFGIENTD